MKTVFQRIVIIPFIWALIGMASSYAGSWNINTIIAQNASDDGPSDIEVEYWGSISNSGSVEELRTYLEQFPTGHFVEAVRGRIDKLNSGSDEVTVSETATSTPGSLRLAILPFDESELVRKTTDYQREKTYLAVTKSLYGEILAEVLGEQQNIDPVWYAYKSKYLLEVEQIPAKIIGKGGSKTFYDSRYPVVDEVIRVGKALDVSVVLLNSILLKRGPDPVSMFLVEVESGKVHLAEGKSHCFTCASYRDGKAEIKKQLRSVFSRFNAEN